MDARRYTVYKLQRMRTTEWGGHTVCLPTRTLSGQYLLKFKLPQHSHGQQNNIILSIYLVICVNDNVTFEKNMIRPSLFQSFGVVFLVVIIDAQ